MAVRLTMFSDKGGVGKTVATVLAAEAAARLGYKVLVVDLDPQGNATRRLKVDVPTLYKEGHPGIADVLNPDEPVAVKDAIVPCGWALHYANRIEVLPSLANLPLQRRAREHTEPGAAFRLKNALDVYDTDHHLTIIDPHPGMDHLAENAMLATDTVYLVVDVETEDGVNGGRTAAVWVLTYGPRLGRTDLVPAGVIVSKYDDNVAIQRELYAALPAYFTFDVAGQHHEIPIVPDPIPFVRTMSTAQHRAVPVVSETHEVVKRRLVPAADGLIKRILSDTYS